MKKIFIIPSLFVNCILVWAQNYPDYKMIVPQILSLNYACNIDNMNTFTYKVENASFFRQVISDSQGNLYFWGVSPYSYDNNNPVERFSITFGSNSSKPISIPRMSSKGQNINTQVEYAYFIIKYNSQGTPLWVSFMTDPPSKMLISESENILYVTYPSVRQINGVSYPLDSIVSNVHKILILYDANTGKVVDYYNRKFFYDFHITETKKVVVHLRQFTSTYFEVSYGIYNRNQVTKWQSKYVNSENFAKLYYNPYQNTLWYIDGLNYYRLLPHPTKDSLIEENIGRKFYRNSPIYLYPRNYVVQKIHFLPDNKYFGEYYNPSRSGEPHYCMIDSLGNVLWSMTFLPAQNMYSDFYQFAFDKDGNMWTDIPNPLYYYYVKFDPSNQSYYINEKNLVSDALWKIDGKTGTLLEAYHKGWGCSTYGGYQLIHVTKQNKLITTPHNYAIAYIPDKSGNFIPYYSTCSGLQQSSTFMWTSYDIDNPVVLNRYEFISGIQDFNSLFSIFPNPSKGSFTIQTIAGGMFELIGLTGNVLRIYEFDTPEYHIQDNLSPGMYFVRDVKSGVIQKIIVE